jgi:hypothetical protein
VFLVVVVVVEQAPQLEKLQQQQLLLQLLQRGEVAWAARKQTVIYQTLDINVKVEEEEVMGNKEPRDK